MSPASAVTAVVGPPKHIALCRVEGCTWTEKQLGQVEISPDVVLGKVVALVQAKERTGEDLSLDGDDTGTETEQDDDTTGGTTTETDGDEDEDSERSEESRANTPRTTHRKAPKRARRTTLPHIREPSPTTIAAFPSSLSAGLPASASNRPFSANSPASSRSSSPHFNAAAGPGSSSATSPPRRPGQVRSISKKRVGRALGSSATASGVVGVASAETMDLDREMIGLMECDVCRNLLYEPATTGCGHVSCSPFMPDRFGRRLTYLGRFPCRRSVDGASPGLLTTRSSARSAVGICPRATVVGWRSTRRCCLFVSLMIDSVNLDLVKLLADPLSFVNAVSTAFSSEYAERKLGVEKSERDARMDVPIFVCTLAFPFMPTILHVFEPRLV